MILLGTLEGDWGEGGEVGVGVCLRFLAAPMPSVLAIGLPVSPAPTLPGIALTLIPLQLDSTRERAVTNRGAYAYRQQSRFSIEVTA